MVCDSSAVFLQPLRRSVLFLLTPFFSFLDEKTLFLKNHLPLFIFCFAKINRTPSGMRISQLNLTSSIETLNSSIFFPTNNVQFFFDVRCIWIVLTLRVSCWRIVLFFVVGWRFNNEKGFRHFSTDVAGAWKGFMCAVTASMCSFKVDVCAVTVVACAVTSTFLDYT